MYIIRHVDGGEASRVRPHTEDAAIAAARRIARRQACTVFVWWCNDARVPKVMVREISAGPSAPEATP